MLGFQVLFTGLGEKEIQKIVVEALQERDTGQGAKRGGANLNLNKSRLKGNLQKVKLALTVQKHPSLYALYDELSKELIDPTPAHAPLAAVKKLALYPGTDVLLPEEETERLLSEEQSLAREQGRQAG
jgi:hypothetical protein